MVFAKVGLALGRFLAGLPINAEAAGFATAVGFAKVGLALGVALAGLAINDEAAGFEPPWTLQKPFLFWDRLSQASPSTMKLQSLPPPCLIPTPREGMNRSDWTYASLHGGITDGFGSFDHDPRALHRAKNDVKRVLTGATARAGAGIDGARVGAEVSLKSHPTRARTVLTRTVRVAYASIWGFAGNHTPELKDDERGNNNKATTNKNYDDARP